MPGVRKCPDGPGATHCTGGPGWVGCVETTLTYACGNCTWMHLYALQVQTGVSFVDWVATYNHLQDSSNYWLEMQNMHCNAEYPTGHFEGYVFGYVADGSMERLEDGRWYWSVVYGIWPEDPNRKTLTFRTKLTTWNSPPEGDYSVWEFDSITGIGNDGLAWSNFFVECLDGDNDPMLTEFIDYEETDTRGPPVYASMPDVIQVFSENGLGFAEDLLVSDTYAGDGQITDTPTYPLWDGRLHRTEGYMIEGIVMTAWMLIGPNSFKMRNGKYLNLNQDGLLQFYCKGPYHASYTWVLEARSQQNGFTPTYVKKAAPWYGQMTLFLAALTLGAPMYITLGEVPTP